MKSKSKNADSKLSDHTAMQIKTAETDKNECINIKTKSMDQKLG